MAHSMSSLAAMESSTLLTSLVKLPSTCLLLSDAAVVSLCVSDLGTYTAARCHVHACSQSPPLSRFPFFASSDHPSFIHCDCLVSSSPTLRCLFFLFLIWKQSPHAIIISRMNQHDKKFRRFILQHVTQKHMWGAEVETGVRGNGSKSPACHSGRSSMNQQDEGEEKEGGTEEWRPTLF